MNVLNVGSCGQEPWIVDSTLPNGAVRIIALNSNLTVDFNYQIIAEASPGSRYVYCKVE